MCFELNHPIVSPAECLKTFKRFTENILLDLLSDVIVINDNIVVLRQFSSNMMIIA